MRNKRCLQEIDTQNRVADNYENQRYRQAHSRQYHIWWADDMVASTPDAGLWLDLGCGTGWNYEVLRMKGHRRRLVGIDISDRMLRFALDKQLPVVMGDAEKLPFRDQSFDGILAKGVLHHLPNMESAVVEIERVLKPGGIVVLSDPNLSPLRVLKHVLKNPDNHFSNLHRSIRPSDLIRKIKPYLEVVGFKYFGFLAYPAAFPDILPVSVSETRMETLIRFDQIIARIPFLNKFCWAFKLMARKPMGGN